jgi:hypothetical protein
MNATMKKLLIVLTLLLATPIMAQDEDGDAQGGQDAQTKALDATATQWSFQFAYQFMPDYYADVVDGQARRPGLDNYLQLRIVAPIPLKGLTILPRLTLRHYEDVSNGKSGLGNTELFALIIPKWSDWGTGRAGLGPLVTTPGNKDVAKDEWGYGLSAAVVNTSGKWFYGVLFTQSWRAVDPNKLQPDVTTDANPLGIAPFLNYRFGDSGYYVGNGDMVALYDWNTSAFYLPLGLRFGKVWVLEKGSINAYVEYQTSAIYKNWSGPAVKNSFRLNFTYTMPVGGGN